MRFSGLASRNMKETYREPVSMALGVALPATFLILFTSMGKNAPLEIFTVQILTPGIIVFSFSFLMMFSAMLLSKDRQSAFLTRLLASPLKPVDFILAYSLPFLPIAFMQIIVCYVVAIVMGIHLTLLIFVLSLLIFLPIAIAFIGLGMILGSLLTENQIAGVGSLIIIIASLFGGAWMDLNLVGGLFNEIGYLLPFAHAIDAARVVSKEAVLNGTGVNMFWVLGYAILFLITGVISFQWKTKG